MKLAAVHLKPWGAEATLCGISAEHEDEWGRLLKWEIPHGDSTDETVTCEECQLMKFHCLSISETSGWIWGNYEDCI